MAAPTERDLDDTLDSGPCPDCGRRNAPDARFCSACGFQLARGREGPAPIGVADPLIGRIIADRYKIEHLLGRGGMGVVYKVEHVHIGKLMAMKLLHGELARDRNTIKRFRREAEAASRLSHPNTVQLFDFGRDEGLMYLVMEYLEGRDLGATLKQEGPLPFTRVARLCEQVCASLAEAHALGIVHRDLKPENIMVVEREDHGDLVKVLDFGLAKLRELEGRNNISITRAGSVLGTPYYMAPEQIRGEDVDHRADIYAVGAVMYKACTGAPPFSAATPMGVLTKHLTEELEPPSSRSDADLPPAVDAIVMRALQKDRTRRYGSISELRDDLVEFLVSAGESTPGSSPRWASARPPMRAAAATRGEVEDYERRLRRRGYVGWFLVVAVLVALGVGGWYLLSEHLPEPIATQESEPNDVPASADLLEPDLAMSAYIGRRISEQRSDADVYLLDDPGDERHTLRVEVSAIPNMDLLLEIVRHGREDPLLVADSGGVGQPERVPNFPLRAARYYLRVREKWVAGERPTENVSDAYTIRWTFVAEEPEDESEINDSLEQASTIRIGGTRRGYVGWAGDVDTYCVDGEGGAARFELDAVPDLDLSLRVVDRATASSEEIDEGRVGDGEVSGVVDAREDRTCVQIAARPAPAASRANADAVYELRLVPAEAP